MELTEEIILEMLAHFEMHQVDDAKSSFLIEIIGDLVNNGANFEQIFDLVCETIKIPGSKDESPKVIQNSFDAIYAKIGYVPNHIPGWTEYQHEILIYSDLRDKGVEHETALFLFETIKRLCKAGAYMNTVIQRMGMFLGVPLQGMNAYSIEKPKELDIGEVRLILNDIGLNEESQEKWIHAFVSVHEHNNRLEVLRKDEDDDESEIEDFIEKINDVPHGIHIINTYSIISICGNREFTASLESPEMSKVLEHPGNYWKASGYDTCGDSSIILLSEKPIFIDKYYGGPTFGLKAATLYESRNMSDTCGVWVWDENPEKAYLVNFDND